ncbi:MAG: sigma-54-dependent Fis family transcriptional regulator [Deltaproteobacteria bacterium]|nr:sigma-54-dependent Fis family transcriptional regulator [Deltaproteobacteria bacterium]
MKNILVCWIGITDLNAPGNLEHVGLGPVAQAVQAQNYDEVVVVSDYPEAKVSTYIKWLKTQTSSKIVVYYVKLSGPTNFGEIYEATAKVVSSTLKGRKEDISLTFHLSPGTPAMAAVWIILAKTRFPAELIESSKESGVRTASVPFDISADFIPDLLRKPDKQLQSLSAGLPPEAPEFGDIIHRSQVMEKVIVKARRIAPRSVPVLIEGESGTGKELLARAIHKASPRRNQPFITVNCGAIPADLIESELFGHEKGAFTGADRQRKGYFEAADSGTLFLDEVAELPLPAQVKLLRALQEGEIVRVGATQPIKVDVRIISATNRLLFDETSRGRFRSDLFYRLAVAVLHLPPLRNRPGDLSLLIDKLLEQTNREGKKEPGYLHKKITASAKNLMLNHDWPGNIRELQNTILRAAVWSGGPSIGKEDIEDALIPQPDKNGSDLLNRSLGNGFNLSEPMKILAQYYLKKALNEAHGNKSQAAKLLGLPSYQTLSNWMKKYDIK